MINPRNWLVGTDWLAAHLDAPDVIILDGSCHLPGSGRDNVKEFHDAHIPGAIFFDIDEIADTSSSLPHMLPPPEKFASRVRKMGIGDGTRIVIYDTTDMSGASRVWWMFRVMGAHDVAVLNGGFKKWQAENRPLESSTARARTELHFTARMNSMLVRDLADVKRLVEQGGADIVDARSAARFRGEEPEPREVPRLGHMPGAKNLPYTELISGDGTLRSPDEIRAIFANIDVDVGSRSSPLAARG